MSYASNTFRRYTGWLPSNPEIYDSFVAKHVDLANRAANRAHKDPVQKFKEAIESDPIMKDLFHQIFLQVSKKNTVSDPLDGQ
jgi:phosphatidylserine decarboxylase